MKIFCSSQNYYSSCPSHILYAFFWNWSSVFCLKSHLWNINFNSISIHRALGSTDLPDDNHGGDDDEDDGHYGGEGDDEDLSPGEDWLPGLSVCWEDVEREIVVVRFGEETGGVVEIAHIGICCQLRFIITWQLSEPRSGGNSHVVISLLLPPSLADTEDNRDDVRAPHQSSTDNITLSPPPPAKLDLNVEYYQCILHN